MSKRNMNGMISLCAMIVGAYVALLLGTFTESIEMMVVGFVSGYIIINIIFHLPRKQKNPLVVSYEEKNR